MPRMMSGRTLLAPGLAVFAVSVAAVAFLLALGVIGPAKAIPTPQQQASVVTATLEASLPAAATRMPSPTAELGTSNLYVEYVIDASGSMTETLPDGSVKLMVAKDLLKEHIAAFRPETNIGLRAYGHRVPFQQEAESCQDIELVAPPKAGQLETIATWLANFQALGMTPLAVSLQQAVSDFVFDPARINSVVVLSDGIETCGGDPCRLVESLKARGINFTVHVIGLNVDDAAREQLSCVAKKGGGAFYDARTGQDVDRALGRIQTVVRQNEIVFPSGVDTPTSIPTPTPQPSLTPTGEPSATATPSDRILFLRRPGASRAASFDGGGMPLEIYAMAPDGSAKTAWTSGVRIPPSSVLRLSVSPDRQYVIFTAQQTLYAMASSAPHGLQPLWTSSGVLGDAMADWSPDGRQIALVLDDQVVVMSTDGSGQKILTTGDVRHWFPSWSPDGRQIAYADDYRLFVMNADGSGKHQLLPGSVRGVAWSPDGSRIAFESGNTLEDGRLYDNLDIWIVNTDGSGLRNLTNTPGVYDDRPSWSPDGASLVFASSNPTSAPSQIIRMEVATGRTWQLTSEGDNQSPCWAR